LKLSNPQLELLLPVVKKEAELHPDPEWDELLNRLVEMALFRKVPMVFDLGLFESPAAVKPRDDDFDPASHPLLK
jgi:hypothetical protein